MRTQEQELQFLALLRKKVNQIAEKDYFGVKGFLSPGQCIQAYKETQEEWNEQQIWAKQPHGSIGITNIDENP